MPNDPKVEKTETDRKIYDYWMAAFKRAGKKMPVKQWKRQRSGLPLLQTGTKP